MDINPGTVTPPSYSVSAGRYYSPQNVKINVENSDDKVYYTTDGSDPTENSIPYDHGTEIHISDTTTLKSIAVNSRGKISEIVSARYEIENIDNRSYYD